jgi:hypothetical protein
MKNANQIIEAVNLDGELVENCHVFLKMFFKFFPAIINLTSN